VDEDNEDENDAVMKIFLMTQDSIDLERPTKAKFAIMWDAMKKTHEPSVIEGSAEADNQLVKIIRKKLRDKQLPHASDHPFGNLRGSHNVTGMGNSWVPSTNKHVVKTAEEMQTDYPVRRDETFRHGYIPYKIDETRLAIEADFPAYLTFNEKTRKTCFILTCPQIGSSLVRPDINKYEFKFWTRVIHLLVSVFLKITVAKYRQECFPDFTTVQESVLSILNTKKGASDHMELLLKSGQLSNVVVFNAPRQVGGANSHATDPGKPEGSHFIETKNRDSMPSADRARKAGKASHVTDPGKPKGSHFIETKNRDSMPSADRSRKAGKASLGKPKGGSTKFYVTEEVNPVDKTLLSEKGSRFANTKKGCCSAGLRGPRTHIFNLHK